MLCGYFDLPTLIEWPAAKGQQQSLSILSLGWLVPARSRHLDLILGTERRGRERNGCDSPSTYQNHAHHWASVVTLVRPTGVLVNARNWIPLPLMSVNYLELCTFIRTHRSNLYMNYAGTCLAKPVRRVVKFIFNKDSLKDENALSM